MLITADAATPHETPNAVMRTLAAPSLGSSELSVWEVQMRSGQSGPTHTADHEQVWVLLDGTLSFDFQDKTISAAHGDAIIVPADAPRRVVALSDARALVASAAAPSVTTPERGTLALPWAQ